MGYQRITDFSNPEALQAKERFTQHIERMPVVEIREDDRIDFADFVDRKKRSLVRSLKDIYDEDYGADQY